MYVFDNTIKSQISSKLDKIKCILKVHKNSGILSQKIGTLTLAYFWQLQLLVVADIFTGLYAG